MSSGDENFLARWSRRKQAVRKAETPAPEEQKPARDAEAEVDAEATDLPLAEAEPDDAAPPEPLPRLEDLTETSDLTAFLRKGVPKALQNAALRKMWSLDPAIRDHIGLAEYAWDFNQPGSMGGFGPLETKEAAAQFLATMSKGLRTESEAVAAEDSVAPEQVTTTSSDQAATACPDESPGVAGPADSTEPPKAPDHLTLAASAPAEDSRPTEASPASPQPRHGSAVPR